MNLWNVQKPMDKEGYKEETQLRKEGNVRK